jgi:hypothetical protein
MLMPLLLSEQEIAALLIVVSHRNDSMLEGVRHRLVQMKIVAEMQPQVRQMDELRDAIERTQAWMKKRGIA